MKGLLVYIAGFLSAILVIEIMITAKLWMAIR